MSQPRVLILDDEPDLRELVGMTLGAMHLEVDAAATVAQARALLAKHQYHLCLTDMRLPDGDGLEVVREIAQHHPQLPVAVITAFGSADNAVAALKAGAFDYVAKPLALEALRTLVRSALSSAMQAQSTDGQSEGPATHKLQQRMLGSSPAIEQVRESIMRLARSMAPVAIRGESGVGKELAARLIHDTSARADKAFIAVNCGAIPEALMEAEFFGYRKGAFTGAEQERDGFFQAADGGTLFLDEVADLPLPMQVKLLRAIQEKQVRKVGATAEQAVDVRILSATHQDLAQCVSAGRFRQDLFYRLNVIELRLPALRERKQDIGGLALEVLQRLARRAKVAQAPTLASVTLKYLESYQFPGNVRELENILERAWAYSDGQVIRVEDLGLSPGSIDPSEPDQLAAVPAEEGVNLNPLEMSAEGVPANLPAYLDHVERESIQRALERTRYNRTAAAKLLGISFRALRYRMQRLDLN
jgi:two-component system, NtrC family, response regulator PilR